MGKVLAIDFGLKRTGLALSDDMKMFAFGYDTVESRDLESVVSRLIISDNVDTIVIGMPKRMNDEDSHISENVRMMARHFEKLFSSCRIVLVDERFTSKMASETMHLAGASKKQKKDKTILDKISATIILQSYLDTI